MQTMTTNSLGSTLVRTLTLVSGFDRFGMGLLRFTLVLVLVWIGGLKFANYEADAIVPLVANSPIMSFLYKHPADYKEHINKEGELVPSHREWHQANGSYGFSHCLGVVIICIGVLIALYPVKPGLSAIGSLLLIFMALTTLSFLVTTPEAWVPPLGDSNHGFPYLSGVGRLIVKDSIMLGAAVVTLADSARENLKRRSALVMARGA